MPPHEITSGGTRQLRPKHGAVLMALLSLTVLDACGSSVTHSPGGSSTRAARTGATAGVSETPAVIAAAVAACKQGADMAHWLPQAGREQLYKLCEHGRSRGIAMIAESARDVCSEIAFTSPAKNAAQRARVLAECQARANGQRTAAPEQ